MTVTELSWTAWPMLRSSIRAAIGLFVIALMAWTLQSWLRTGYFTVLAVLLMWSQVAGFYLPTHYTLTDENVRVRGIVSRKEKGWSEFRSFHRDREGVLLSPFVLRSRLERFRGVSLQFHGNSDEVMAIVERMIPDYEEDVGDVVDEGGEGGDEGQGAV